MRLKILLFSLLVTAAAGLVHPGSAEAYATGLHPRGPAIAVVPVDTGQVEGTTTDSPKTVPEFTAAASSSPVSEKQIFVSLKDQTLKYFQGTTLVGEFKISSGVKALPTPPGTYTILVKKPVVDYKGPNYDYPDTKWNLMFKRQAKGNLYIHGAYWHHNFGHPMSHGCINVSYANMQPLYDWADVGTTVTIE